MVFQILDIPKVGEHYMSGRLEVVITRVVEDAGTRKVWFRRADGRTITYGALETWAYEQEFHERFRSLHG